MIINQVSVFLENKSGRLNEVTQILGNAGINISAFTIADTSDFGILRMIVSDPGGACEILKQNQYSVKTTEVVLVKTSNQPGSLSRLLSVLNNGGVFIEYMYAFSREHNSATIVIRPSSTKKCVEIIQNHGDDFPLLQTDSLL